MPLDEAKRLMLEEQATKSTTSLLVPPVPAEEVKA
jgi:hypothetical protein